MPMPVDTEVIPISLEPGAGPGDAVILSRELMTRPQLLPFLGGEVAVFSMRRPRKETENEDGLAIIPVDENRGVLAVADGIGGQPAGEDAAEYTLTSLCAELHGAAGGSAMRQPIVDALTLANKEVARLGAGTTVAVAEIAGNRIRPYHVGDSIVLLAGQRGKVRMTTTPHSPVGQAVRTGKITPDDAMHHRRRHIVSNLVGFNNMWIDVGPPIEMGARDTLVVASDGLFDNLLEDEIVDIIRSGRVEDAASRLVEVASQRMLVADPTKPCKPDDLSFILYRRKC